MNSPKVNEARQLAQAAQAEALERIRNGATADVTVVDQVIADLSGAITDLCEVLSSFGEGQPIP